MTRILTAAAALLAATTAIFLVAAGTLALVTVPERYAAVAWVAIAAGTGLATLAWLIFDDDPDT